MSFGFGFALPAYPLRGGGGNNPFNQLGATLDLSFVGTAGDLSGVDTYTLNTDFITPEYQVAAQYAVWVDGTGMVSKNFADIVTFTRASTATYFNSAGTLTSAAINEARFDYNPSTLAPLGFLIEESRTNSIRNNTMQGAVAGTPGANPTNWTVTAAQNGITKTIVGVGTENGISYVDIQYTTGGGNTSASGSLIVIGDLTTQVSAAFGQTWTGSCYLKLQAGSTANLTSIVTNVAERTAAGSLLAFTTSSISPTSAALATQRNVVTRTLTDAATERVSSSIFSASYASGVAIDITLRIGLPQLELGAFATSVIPTTTIALTRNADVASVNTLSPWFNATEGTLFGEYQTLSAGTAQFVAAITSVSETDRITISQSTTTYVGTVVDTGVSQVSLTQGTTSSNSAKIALAYLVNNFAFSANGGAPVTDVTGTVPGNLTEMKLGRRGVSTSPLSGHLRRITYYPRRLSNADLQTITT